MATKNSTDNRTELGEVPVNLQNVHHGILEHSNARRTHLPELPIDAILTYWITEIPTNDPAQENSCVDVATIHISENKAADILAAISPVAQISRYGCLGKSYSFNFVEQPRHCITEIYKTSTASHKAQPYNADRWNGCTTLDLRDKPFVDKHDATNTIFAADTPTVVDMCTTNDKNNVVEKSTVVDTPAAADKSTVTETSAVATKLTYKKIAAAK